jgi:putative ABC transport system permease protein
VLTGDRGLSYSADVPEGSRVIAGNWWASDYAGEPLVSVEANAARGLGVAVGDSLTINVLGRNVVARIANLREVKWESLSLNFVLVFSPNTLRGAPHNLLATITLPSDASVAQEASIARLMGREFPATTAIRVKDAIQQFNVLFARIMTAVRSAASVTLLAGALVLAGALATAQRRRIKEAVILKVLGATRRRILGAHFTEYALLALATAGIATAVGAAAAYVTVTQIMRLPFIFSIEGVLTALGVALALVFIFGAVGTWRVLAARPVPHLRSN